MHYKDETPVPNIETKRKRDPMLNEIAGIRLRDLEIFEEVARARSIREVARRLDSTAGQVSKSIQNLERLVGTKLFRRSVSGVLLTSQGKDLQEIVHELLESGAKIESLVSNRNKAKFAKVLAVAGTSFLNTHFTIPTTCRFAAAGNSTVFRFLDLAPDQVVSVGIRGGFDIAVHYGTLNWPNTWVTKRLGKSRWVLCARLDHPLPKRPSLKQVLECSFVVPTYWTSEGLVHGNDQFPLPISKRKSGYETATADAAIPILLNTDQIAFLPNLLVRSFIQSQDLRELRVEDLPAIEKEMFLSAKSDVVPDSVFQGLSAKMSEQLG
jgi:DNA-binding transcriptional LysR family regulator